MVKEPLRGKQLPVSQGNEAGPLSGKAPVIDIYTVDCKKIFCMLLLPQLYFILHPIRIIGLLTPIRETVSLFFCKTIALIPKALLSSGEAVSVTV